MGQRHKKVWLLAAAIFASILLLTALMLCIDLYDMYVKPINTSYTRLDFVSKKIFQIDKDAIEKIDISIFDGSCGVTSLFFTFSSPEEIDTVVEYLNSFRFLSCFLSRTRGRASHVPCQIDITFKKNLPENEQSIHWPKNEKPVYLHFAEDYTSVYIDNWVYIGETAYWQDIYDLWWEHKQAHSFQLS